MPRGGKRPGAGPPVGSKNATRGRGIRIWPFIDYPKFLLLQEMLKAKHGRHLTREEIRTELEDMFYGFIADKIDDYLDGLGPIII